MVVFIGLKGCKSQVAGFVGSHLAFAVPLATCHLLLVQRLSHNLNITIKHVWRLWAKREAEKVV